MNMPQKKIKREYETWLKKRDGIRDYDNLVAQRSLRYILVDISGMQ